MGNLESDICETCHICGDLDKDNEIQDDYYASNSQNNNQQYNNQQQYNTNPYPPPITSNVNTYNNNTNVVQTQVVSDSDSTDLGHGAHYDYDIPIANKTAKTKTQNYQSQTVTNTNTYYKPPQKSKVIKKSANQIYGYYDTINRQNIQSSYHWKSDIIHKIDQKCDMYCTEMFNKKIQEITNQNAAKISYPICRFPSPYIELTSKTVQISCCSSQRNDIYFLPAIDEYFGDLSEAHKYDTLNERYKMAPVQDSVMNTQEAKAYTYHMIYKPLFDTNNKIKKQYEQWASVRLEKLQGLNTYEGNIDDLWLTLIAFSGFAAHRTVPVKHSDFAYACDVTFLAFYQVKNGYFKYGAQAFFDKNFFVKKIYLSHNGRMYTPDAYSQAEWEHAKWVWKVSVTVAVFLVDMIAHCRFRESSGLIKAVQSTLNPNHPIRRLLLPFTYGTVYSNRIYSEYLKQNGLFHRSFAFTYDELSRLITDAMMDAPEQRQRKDDIKYRWKFARKKCSPMKHCPEQIYPFYSDLYSFWVDTLDFVTNYVFTYYGFNEDDNSKLHSDTEMVAFYKALIKNSGIDGKFKLKKYNITNMLTHFICNATLWNNHLSSSVGFEYLIDPKFNGLKINNSMNSYGNNTQQYIEYCTVALSKAWNLMDFKGHNIFFVNSLHTKNTIWQNVCLKDNKWQQNQEFFNKYFNIGVKKNYNKQRIVPYTAANPNYFSCSIHH